MTYKNFSPTHSCSSAVEHELDCHLIGCCGLHSCFCSLHWLPPYKVVLLLFASVCHGLVGCSGLRHTETSIQFSCCQGLWHTRLFSLFDGFLLQPLAHGDFNSVLGPLAHPAPGLPPGDLVSSVITTSASHLRFVCLLLLVILPLSLDRCSGLVILCSSLQWLVERLMLV